MGFVDSGNDLRAPGVADFGLETLRNSERDGDVPGLAQETSAQITARGAAISFGPTQQTGAQIAAREAAVP